MKRAFDACHAANLAANASENSSVTAGYAHVRERYTGPPSVSAAVEVVERVKTSPTSGVGLAGTGTSFRVADVGAPQIARTSESFVMVVIAWCEPMER